MNISKVCENYGWVCGIYEKKINKNLKYPNNTIEEEKY